MCGRGDEVGPAGRLGKEWPLCSLRRATSPQTRQLQQSCSVQSGTEVCGSRGIHIQRPNPRDQSTLLKRNNRSHKANLPCAGGGVGKEVTLNCRKGQKSRPLTREKEKETGKTCAWSHSSPNVKSCCRLQSLRLFKSVYGCKQRGVGAGNWHQVL